MKKSNEKHAGGLPEIGLGLNDLIRRGAREVIQQAIEAELAQLLEQHESVKTLTGSRAVAPSQHGRAKKALQEIWMSATRTEVVHAFEHFLSTYGTKYPKATEKLTKDREALLAFYDFPAEHWARLRTTNPIESTFATVRHRTTRTRNCVSRATFLGLAFKLIEEAEKSWRRIREAERNELLLKGVPFQDGIAVPDNPPHQQNLAA